MGPAKLMIPLRDVNGIPACLSLGEAGDYMADSPWDVSDQRHTLQCHLRAPRTEVTSKSPQDR